MVGVSRNGPPLAAPVEIIDLTNDCPECEGKRAANLKVFESDAAVCAQQMRSIAEAIDTQEHAITASRRNIETIERDVSANRAARDNWSKKQRQFGDLATANQHKREDFDKKIESARARSSQLQNELKSASEPGKSAAIQEKIAQNDADLENFAADRETALRARNDADKIRQFIQAQIDNLKRDETTTLKDSREQEESKIATANYKLKDLKNKLQEQEELLRQIDERKDKNIDDWADCCRKALDARSH